MMFKKFLYETYSFTNGRVNVKIMSGKIIRIKLKLYEYEVLDNLQGYINKKMLTYTSVYMVTVSLHE